MRNSSFYNDGYKDGAEGRPPAAAHHINVYAAEYRDGYRDGKFSRVPFDPCNLFSKERRPS